MDEETLAGIKATIRAYLVSIVGENGVTPALVDQAYLALLAPLPGENEKGFLPPEAVVVLANSVFGSVPPTQANTAYYTDIHTALRVITKPINTGTDFGDAWDELIKNKSSELDPGALENLMKKKSKLHDAFIRVTTGSTDAGIHSMTPGMFLSDLKITSSGNVPAYAALPDTIDLLREVLADLGTLPLEMSDGYLEELGNLAGKIEETHANALAKATVIIRKLQNIPGGISDEITGEFIPSPEDEEEAKDLMAQLDALPTDLMSVVEGFARTMPTEDDIAAGKVLGDEQALLENRPGKDKLVGKWGEENFTVENGLRDSGGLLTDLGKKWMKKIQAEFDLQWEGRASGVTDWRGLLTDIVSSGSIQEQFAQEDAKAAQKLADEAQDAADAESKRFVGLKPRGMVNEIATNMGLLTADTDPLMLARLFGTSEASMSVMNQVRDRMATAPAGTDYKELVKEIIENIDSPQMRPDAPPGVPGTAAANQALYSDYQKLLNDYNTSTLSEDVKGPRFQEALATLIRDNNLGVDIPTDGSPINQADVILAITGQPMDITGIIDASPAAVAAAADAAAAEADAAADADAIARKAAAPQVMQESQANLNALATKYGINLDEYTEGTNAEIDAALAAFDKASSESQYVTPIPQQPSAPVQPPPPQAEGYIAPDPGAVSYGGEGQLTKEEWIEKFYPGKTEGVDLFIPEGQDIYIAPTAGETAEADAARVAEEAEAERLKAEKIADTERRRLIALQSAPRGRSRAVR